MSFVNKVVLVTGGSSGIGASAALAFTREGADVCIVGRNESRLAAVSAQCAAVGKTPLAITADVSRDEDVAHIVSKVIDRHGKLDVLINNAGVSGLTSILDGKFLEEFDKIMNVNLRGSVHLTNLSAPYLIKTKGVIINVSSVLGSTLARNYTRTVYGMSKAALEYFTKGTALELSAHGVRVNAVSPGLTKTGFLDNNNVNFSWEKAKEYYSVDRVIEADEIADLIIYLCSDKAKSITGSNYIIDNAALLKN